ncbi:MAG: glycoside hydrolase family 1 [Proteobacteria bacterium]|nr:MAG: glycoside hydrolase family 1 [Pseudomonadota bacterium]
MSAKRSSNGNLAHQPHRRPDNFLFATGIECSYPVVTGKDGRDHRVDQMAKCHHYERWKEDFELVRELGLDYLRFGPPYYREHLGPGRYNWEFADQTFGVLRRMGIHPIVDLCHFGVPDWAGNFQNPDWPRLFAEYAGAFARRFPWVRLYTPVNEIFVTATFSGQYGWWNERLSSDLAFVTALKHLAKANLLAEQAILDVQPDALFIQSESSEYFHAADPAAHARAAVFNHKRFLSLDLSYGHDVRGVMYEYLMDNGMTREEYHWFLDTAARLRPYCVMGNDYYHTNEHIVPGQGPVRPAGEIFGYYVITRQYYERYHLPVMHTETNLGDSERAPGWLWKEWANMVRLKDDGVPIIGFTWYSLTDQMDWDTCLREDNHNVNPLGLYDLDRKIRPVGQAYKELVAQWRHIMPTESLCLHHMDPDEYETSNEGLLTWGGE